MTKPSTQMNGQSLDIAEQRRKELEQLFPGIFTETRNDQGELKVSIDLERLKAELGEFTDIYDSRTFSMNHALLPAPKNAIRDCRRVLDALKLDYLSTNGGSV